MLCGAGRIFLWAIMGVLMHLYNFANEPIHLRDIQAPRQKIEISGIRMLSKLTLDKLKGEARGLHTKGLRL